MRRLTRGLIPAAILVMISGCVSPEVEAKQWDEIQTVSQTVTELRTYVTDLEQLVDSLRILNLRQDSAIKTLADFTGAIVPGYRQ